MFLTETINQTDILPPVLNVAAGKAPMQSSVAAGGIPQKAVDGSTATAYTEGSVKNAKQNYYEW